MHEHGIRKLLHIDGSRGEGGGQILRSSLAMSLCLGIPFHITGVRASRRKPGLQPQHLAAVRAAAGISAAALEGATPGSGELRFAPQAVRPGHYRFATGTAGSATLVLQTVLPALLTADRPSHLELYGGLRRFRHARYQGRDSGITACRTGAPLPGCRGAGR